MAPLVAEWHVGMLVGRNAHRDLWPEIVDWMLAQAVESTAPA